MPIEYNWIDSEETILRVTYPSQWKWNDLYDIQKEINALLNTSSKSVALVHDLSRIRSLPPNAIGHIKNVVLRIHPNIKVMVYVGMNRFVRTIWDLISKLGIDRLVPVSFVFAESVEQGVELGRQILREINQSQP